MTIQQFIEKPRNIQGQYVKTTPNGWKAKGSEYQREYLRTHPWARNWQFSKTRAKRRGMEHTLTVADFQSLWERDRAHLLTKPSIDRIDPRRGYVEGNCRFIEASLNSRLGNEGVKRFRECPNCDFRPN